ncbi:hypothetical protein EIP86_005323 [Pleurotus ostreatoroseus]|nr:hypothetical protein EIP86_005323 [Pleurotus ostreatoroseus]
MGNAPSSQSVRSRTSQKSRTNSFLRNRSSRAVSFYATPPGSLDLEERPSSSSRSTPSSPTIAQEPAPKREDSQAKRDDEQTERVWKPGVYTLINAGTGTVLDLSDKDKRSVIGFSPHYGPNQQWVFTALGDGYTVRSVTSGLYLTIEETALGNEPAIVASPFPVAWKIKAAAEGGELFLRIFWPSETYSFDLADGKPETKVRLAAYKPQEACQLWRVLEHEGDDVLESSKEASANELSVASPPAETLVISEDRDCITTTRTTTTVTTVTTVTKTPRSSPML